MVRAKAKQCGVCGDVGCGRYFNATTCRSCRTFFQNNYLKIEELLCLFGDNCKVDKSTRIYCQKCRLKKCFAIGMKKAVNPDETKMSLPPTSSELPIRIFEENKELNFNERHMLEELIVANEDLKMPLERGINDPSLLDVINMTDLAIRRLIQMSVKLKGFTTLSQIDQIALLKHGVTELIILRSVMSYNPVKRCWEHSVKQGPKMSIKVNILKEARGNVYKKYRHFVTSFRPQWSTDENIMVILSAIVLFTPERANIENKAILKILQKSYYDLLQSYLDSMFSRCEAKATYIELACKIQSLHSLNDDIHVSVYRDVNPSDVLPILVEIYDLKH